MSMENELIELPRPNVYPNLTFVRVVVEDQHGNQQMCVVMSSIIRLKDDISRGTIVSVSVVHDVEDSVEDTMAIEMELSKEFHRRAVNIFNGVEENDAPTFDVDDPNL